ncbi:MAG: dihydrofolate reductase family protein [Anaerolineae bacterium]|nr:dihydrofolate reductase family protein [Anaerolineae bacterium]RIK21808.1 MAG: pyrimidine reductase [Anaerolineae bacterium]
MISDTIWQLYPMPTREISLAGLYLSHELRQIAADLDRPFVYTNYVTSIDGRIAIPRPEGKGMMVPKDTANDRDWRLFQELAVQADVIISSGRYLRDYAEGKAQEILRVYDEPRFADLGRWRADRGLPPYPDLAVVSGSLDFSIPPFLTQSGRKVVVVTHDASHRERRIRLEQDAGKIILAGEADVSGRQAIDALGALGYRTIYMATGPRVHHLLLTDNILDRLYTTVAHRLLGGEPFSSLVEGDLLRPAVGMRLHALYFDPHALGGLGQQYTCYER